MSEGASLVEDVVGAVYEIPHDKDDEALREYAAETFGCTGEEADAVLVECTRRVGVLGLGIYIGLIAGINLKKEAVNV